MSLITVKSIRLVVFYSISTCIRTRYCGFILVLGHFQDYYRNQCGIKYSCSCTRQQVWLKVSALYSYSYIFEFLVKTLLQRLLTGTCTLRAMYFIVLTPNGNSILYWRTHVLYSYKSNMPIYS